MWHQLQREGPASRHREQLGLDKPIAVQYVNWLGNVARGDLGSSALFHTPVATSLKQRLPVTIELLIYTEILALLLARARWRCSPRNGPAAVRPVVDDVRVRVVIRPRLRDGRRCSS